MNVLLIQPHFRKIEKSYPLGLGYISSALKQGGHKVVGADTSFISPGEVCKLMDLEDIGLVGISMISYNYQTAVALCRRLKKHRAVPIVAGGPHVTIFREKILHDYGDCFDYLITGEGERPFLRLIESLQGRTAMDDVENLIFKDGAKVVSNKPHAASHYPESAVFCDRKLFPILKYKGMFTKKKHYTQIVTSRGCFRSCLHCPEPALWGGWSGRSIDHVVSEIRMIVRDFNIREFHIEDANFLGGGTARIKTLCETLIEKAPDIKWCCPNGIPIMELEDISVLEPMAKAGCYSICLGIESFDKEILARMGREADADKVKAIVKAAHKAGMDVVGYFIIGLPGQGFKSIKNDIALSRRLGLDFIHYSLFHRIPGSSFYQTMAASAVKARCLKRARITSLVMNCLSIRVLLFCLRNLIICKNPFRVLSRMLSTIRGPEIKFSSQQCPETMKE